MESRSTKNEEYNKSTIVTMKLTFSKHERNLETFESLQSEMCQLKSPHQGQ